MIRNIFTKLKLWQSTDRIGPDIFWTHWQLFFYKRMTKLCKKKFKKFGVGSEIRPGAYVVGCSQISIGDRVIIRPASMIHGESNSLKNTIIIDDDVLMGSGVNIYVENHNYSKKGINIIDQGHSQAKLVHLKKGCWIGANAIILPGVVIGENSVVAAGSVVTKEVPGRTVVAGNPAKALRKI